MKQIKKSVIGALAVIFSLTAAVAIKTLMFTSEQNPVSVTGGFSINSNRPVGRMYDVLQAPAAGNAVLIDDARFDRFKEFLKKLI